MEALGLRRGFDARQGVRTPPPRPPTLFLYGADSPRFHTYAYEAAVAAAPRSRVVPLPSLAERRRWRAGMGPRPAPAGHWLSLCRPADVNSEIERWLREQETQDTECRAPDTG